jgi:hypothetical protein
MRTHDNDGFLEKETTTMSQQNLIEIIRTNNQHMTLHIFDDNYGLSF